MKYERGGNITYINVLNIKWIPKQQRTLVLNHAQTQLTQGWTNSQLQIVDNAHYECHGFLWVAPRSYYFWNLKSATI